MVTALWDLRAKRVGLPLWDLLAGMAPEELVDLVDLCYLTDALTPQEALGLLQAQVPHRDARRSELLTDGYPAYTTTPGWLGYDDAKLQRLCREAVADGFTQVKLKVGADLDDDDVLGHAGIARGIAPLRVATGEHAANRVVFKQLLRSGGMHVMQIDATRVAGVNENMTNLLLAAKFGVPVCAHAGGVGLCEAVRHLSMFDLVAVSGSSEGRLIEYVDHLHEHFVTPTVIRDGRYVAPLGPGAGTEMLLEPRHAHRFPDGAVWVGQGARTTV